jgi:hypothetical protein
MQSFHDLIDLGRFSKIIKYLTILPLLAGILLVTEIFLPLEVVETSVIGKNKDYRTKTSSYRYTVYFDDLKEQVTEDIYMEVETLDNVILRVRPFTQTVEEVFIKKYEHQHQNDSGETTATTVIGILFLMCGLIWFKRGNLHNFVAMLVAVMIILAIIQIYRIFF